ncbi:tryptophan 2,3-dioxygenase family protein [Micromonospora chersina]|uniref:tryptophan 2,3-dioxygenase family protein n=1 Tax=Micromonospora chersina TaxID=47854 RepID=UPI0037136866
MDELTAWLADPDPVTFPYAQVLAGFHRTGKHFVADRTLQWLAMARDAVPGTSTAADRLVRWLDVLLDKWDGRYDYRSYLALRLLAIPTAGSTTPYLEQRDRLVAGLLGDVLGFEHDAADGRTEFLPQMRPGADIVAKRHRLGLKVAVPALARLGGGPVTTGLELRATMRRLLTDDEIQSIALSILPVYVSHDEYLFIRVLQIFETTFAMLVLELRAGVAALDAGAWTAAADRVTVAAQVLTESAPTFSLLATMQVESFRTFRRFTEGASAIQSRNYRLLESLCRLPDDERLSSAAFDNTPEVRDEVLAGLRTLEQAYTEAVGRNPPPDAEPAVAAFRTFAAAVRRWRQTHYRLAVRMIGDRTGTGYTEGTPYLSEVRKIPVFLRPDLDVPPVS